MNFRPMETTIKENTNVGSLRGHTARIISGLHTHAQIHMCTGHKYDYPYKHLYKCMQVETLMSNNSWMWRYSLCIISAHWRLRQEDCQLEVSLGSIVKITSRKIKMK